MKFSTDNFGKRDDFTWIAKVITAAERDSTPEHKERIGASPDTEVNQFVLELEGISVEWIGDYGNCRLYTADLQDADGNDKEGRNFKAYYTLASLCAPEDADAAYRAGYRKGGKGVPGLGFDGKDPDFPACLEGHIFKVANRSVTFGKDRETGEPIDRSVLVFLAKLPDDYVYEGTRPKLTYGNRATAPREAGEGTEPIPFPTTVADPAAFFAAIDGKHLKMADLLMATKDDPGLNVDPYRSLIATKSGLKALAESDYVEVDEEGTIEVVNAGATIEDLEALLKG